MMTNYGIIAFALYGGGFILRQYMVTRHTVRSWPSRPKRLPQYHVSGEVSHMRDEQMIDAVKMLLPEWKEITDISIITIQGGITNQLYLLVSEEKAMKVLVRLYGKNSDKLIKRSEECLVFHVLSEKGFAPKLLGTFDNGRIEEYIPSIGIAPSEMGSSKYQRLIAKELELMHELHIPGRKTPNLWRLLKRFRKTAFKISFPTNPEMQQDLDNLDLNHLGKVLDDLQRYLPSVRNRFGRDFIRASQNKADKLALQFLFESVFCHNDLLHGNLLYVEQLNKIQIIDFEYGKYNFRGYDVANHFCEYAGFDFDLEKWYPSWESQEAFLKSYIFSSYVTSKKLIALRKELEGDEALWKAFVDVCVTWISKFTLASHFVWGLWAVVQQAYSPIDFDYLGYAKLRLGNIPRSLPITK